MNFRHLYLYIPVFLFAFSAVAQSTSSRFKFEDEILIQDQFQNLEISDAAVKTEVITAKEIKSKHYQNAAQVTEQMAGVHITQSERRSGFAASIQGLSEDHVLVIVDGIRQEQSSSYGFDLSQISADDIERIEVIKGAASALYGSQAMGGVINITTKKPKDKVSYNLKLESGAYGLTEPESVKSINQVEPSQTANLSAHVSQRLDKFSYKIGGSFRETEAVNRDKETITEDAAAQEKWNVGYQLGYQTSDTLYFHNLKFFKEELNSKVGIPVFADMKAYDNSTEMNSINTSLGAEHNYSTGNQVKALVTYTEAKDELILRDDPETSILENFESATYETVRSELTWKRLFFENHLVTSGVAIGQSYLDRTSENSGAINKDVDAKEYQSAELFIQDDIIFNKWEVVPGFRQYYDPDFGANISPKLSIKHNLVEPSDEQKRTLLFSAGTGYRVPSLKERFYYLDHTVIDNYIVEGNESLQPETSLNIQIGAELKYHRDHSFYINAFNTYVNDMIKEELVDANASPRIYRYGNLDEVEIRGLELQQLSQLGSDFSLKLSYTLTDSEVEGSNKELTFLPKQLATASINYKMSPEFNILADYRYKSEQFTDEENLQSTPGFGVLGLKANYKYDKSSTIYTGVENIGDVTRPAATDGGEDISDQRPAVGRYFYLGVRIEG